ncbi:AraC-type DNA-binding protein [Filimonas lacunae]|uniref:AraC-type DNA-binding protein n=1 Tax=Filimonas lacunae TaxID=477680 RepID=A0A173MLN5_9BACT|nr:AraC family transcriptional regulator [Filimonas lacunae]BAV08308.1 transcriptional regulator [Filimonas lacunae]SIT33318.1 AraC-type DNA-binding protein [Filimonas lacunae]
MKAIPYLVSVQKESSIVVEADELPFFYNQLHHHKEMQITLIESGEGVLIVGNYSQPFEAGQVYIIGANQPHMFKTDASLIQKKTKSKAVHIFFDMEKLRPCFGLLPELTAVEKLVSRASCGLQLNEGHRKQIGREIQFIEKSEGLTRLTTLLHLLEYIAAEVQLCRDLGTGISSPAKTFSGFRMDDVYKYTLENYHKDVSIQQIAEVACLTPHAFCKYFKKHTRKTYLTFLNEIRISEACKKITLGEYEGLSSLGYSTGFNNAVTFNRVFKRVIGMAPSDYVKKVRGERVMSE